MHRTRTHAAFRIAAAMVTWSAATAAAGPESELARWTPGTDCTVTQTNVGLHILSTGVDPTLVSPEIRVPGPVQLDLRMRSRADGRGAVYWIEEGADTFTAAKAAWFRIAADGQWHDYTVELPTRAHVTRLRLDPASAPGQVDVAAIRARERLAVLRERDQEPVRSFTVDAAGQAHGNRIFRLVDNTTATGHWRDLQEPLPDNWAADLYEGIILYNIGWWHMSDPRENYERTHDGEFVFKPTPHTAAAIDAVLKSGLEPRMYFGSNTIPAPLIEGGYTEGTYMYNIRQPSDYGAWQRYIESTVRWLAERYGRDRVRRWSFRFGIESDWQFKAVYPGTDRIMSEEDNRREFMKLFDHFHAALVKVLGPTVYAGIYVAKVTQAPMYLEHWARGTNYATGRTGTRVGYIGFSDWYHMWHEPFGDWYEPQTYSLNPFAQRPAAEENVHAMAHHGGMVWKYRYLRERLDRYPELKGTEICMPESGYIQINSAFPASLVLADYRGAALSCMRTIAYADCPLLTAACNRHGLTTGTRRGYSQDRAKAPVFHALRLQKTLAGMRQLPVAVTGTTRFAASDVRLAAAAADDGSGRLHVVAVNFCDAFFLNEFDASTRTETVRIELHNLSSPGAWTMRETRIDPAHNNWWAEWRQFREQRGLQYVGNTYGPWSAATPYFLPHINDIYDTMKPEDRQHWQDFIPRYEEAARLAETGRRVLEPENGTLLMTFDITGQSVLYLEFEPDQQPPTPLGLAFTGARDADTTADRSGVLRVGQSATSRVDALDPASTYTCVVEAQASARLLDYTVSIGPPGSTNRTTAAGQRNARRNRLVITGAPDANGNLLLDINVPEQPAEPTDTVTVISATLHPNPRPTTRPLRHP